MAMMNGLYQKFPQPRVIGNTEPAKGVEAQSKERTAPSGSSNSQQQYQQYQQNMVNTASPQELTLMLYNGLIRFLRSALQFIDMKDNEKAGSSIIRSQDIISEFMCTLNMQYEISNSLMSLYDYMKRRLIEANIKKDKAIIEEVLGYAEELRDTWVQAMKIAKQQQAVNK